MAAIPVSEEKHCRWNFWLVFTLACLKAHFGPSPSLVCHFQPHTPYHPVGITHTLSYSGTRPCQAQSFGHFLPSYTVSYSNKDLQGGGNTPTSSLSWAELLSVELRCMSCVELHWVDSSSVRSVELSSCNL